MTDRELMLQVKSLAGDALAEFAGVTSTPIAFYAALTANESAGKITAARFEPAVYAHLKAVALGIAASYGSIREVALDQEAMAEVSVKADSFHQEFLSALFNKANRDEIVQAEDGTLRDLATSWGYTQIMGYHVIEWGTTVDRLIDPSAHYQYAGRLMAGFVQRFGLDQTKDFEEMARCWNTGRPDGRTWDPNYVGNLAVRMAVWDEIAVSY
jgi:hypothetical protein